MTAPPHRRLAAPAAAVGLAAALALALPAPHARAAPEALGGSGWLGLTGGFQVTSGDVDMLGDRTLDTRIDNAPHAGLRFGVGLAPPLSLELLATWMPVTTQDGARSGGAVNALLELVGHFLPGPVVLDVAGGAGVVALAYGDLGTDVDLLLSAGVGVRWLLAGDRLALRADARALFSDGVETSLAAHALFLAGLDVRLWSAPEPPPPPPPPPSDIDRDGVPDLEDRCSDQRGLLELRGCPDSDGDGVAEPDDACPETAGPPALNGCPDTDGDGIPDTTDACPTLAGLEALNGCPDSDDDGVADGFDLCPRLKGAPADAGCPSPTAEELALFGRPLDGVAFRARRAELLPESRAALARVADLLARYPQLQVEVQAHVGRGLPKAKALALTEARAEAVARRLVALGVEARRVRAAGYGTERPIASNATSRGRKLNERLEIHLVGK